MLDSAAPVIGDTPRSSRAPLPRIKRASFLIAGAAWVYAIAVMLVLVFRVRPQADLEAIAAWGAFPLQAVTLILGAVMLLRRGLVALHHRRVSWVLLAFTAVNTLATYFWNTEPAGGIRKVLNLSDILYLASYWLLIAAFVALFNGAGGSFRLPRVWLDIALMMSVQLVAVWSFILSPSAPFDPSLTISTAATAAYSITLASLLTMAGMVCLQLPSYRGRYALFFLICAAGCVVGSEMSWLLSDATTGAFYNYGDVLCFASLISGVTALRFQAHFTSQSADTEKQIFSFLPILAVLAAIALMAGLVATHREDVWIDLPLVALCIQLLIARQASMRKEMRDFNHQLAAREADARISELVRRSDDLIVVIDRGGLVSFASAAVESMLGISPVDVQGVRVVELFGSLHRVVIQRFLDAVCTGDPISTIELHVDHVPGDARDLKIGASDQLQNPAIRGVVLTVHDVSEQRALEREVLDIASRERIRLCADLHDGLGQELTGIALLLHAAAVAPDPDAERQRARLEEVVGHVNRAIGAARDLARGYSPLHVVRGSLSAALRRLTHDASPTLPIRLQLDARIDDRLIGDFAADHLYRIVLESIANAQRHSGASHIDVGMRSSGGNVVLSIEDDGTGMTASTAEHDGLGLRLMSYRARLIGGVFGKVSSPGRGTRIEVTVPLSQSTGHGAGGLS